MNKEAMQNMSVDDFSTFTRSIMAVLDGWGLNAVEQLSVLNLPEKTPSRALRKYRDGQPFPKTTEVLERLEHITGIFEALRTSYPHHQQMGMMWMKKCNRHFVKRTPVRVIKEDGLDGLLQVRGHLDCTFDWFSA